MPLAHFPRRSPHTVHTSSKSQRQPHNNLRHNTFAPAPHFSQSEGHFQTIQLRDISEFVILLCGSLDVRIYNIDRRLQFHFKLLRPNAYISTSGKNLVASGDVADASDWSSCFRLGTHYRHLPLGSRIAVSKQKPFTFSTAVLSNSYPVMTFQSIDGASCYLLSLWKCKT